MTMDAALQANLIALKVSGDNVGFSTLLWKYGDGIEQDALALLPAVGGGTYATDSLQLAEAVRVLLMIDRSDKASAALAAADRRLALLALTESEADPLDPAAFTAATKAADSYPEYSPRVIAIQQDALSRVQAEVSLWRSGKNITLPDTLPVLLRTSVDGARVETSKGVSVPIGVVERIWQLTSLARSEGRTLTPEDFLREGGNGIGEFTLTAVATDSSIVVSCHSLDSYEVERIFKRLGLATGETT